MHVNRGQDGRWIIHSFVKEHNHETAPDKAYYFRGDRKIDLDNHNADDIWSRTKKMFVKLSRRDGGIKNIRMKIMSLQILVGSI